MCFRISEAIRIAGSLVFILLLFILTAVLVKVPMEEDCFFSVTMATIWFINCKSVCFYVYVGDRCVWVIRCYNKSPLFSSLVSVWCRAAGQSVRSCGDAASEVQQHLHEWPGPRWDIRCHRHANSHRKWVTYIHTSFQWAPNPQLLGNQGHWKSTGAISMTPHSTLLSKKPEHTWFCWTLFFFSYISVPEYFSNSALCAFVTQVKRTMKRQLWVTSSHRVWGRCSHSSATWCCHAWSVSCPLSITALPTIHLTSPIQTLHTHYLLSDSVCGEFVCRWTWMWAFVAFFRLQTVSSE